MLGQVERQRCVLLDDQHRDPHLAVDLAQDPEQFLDDQRREPEGRLVEQHQAGPQHQPAADRQHLLLAARQRPSLLSAPFLEARKMRVHLLDIRGDAGPVVADHRAELQVFFDRDAQKCAAAFRHVGDAEAHDILGRPAGDPLAGEADVAAGAHHAAERAQHRRFAGAVGPQEGAHPPLVESESDPEQRLDFAIERVEIGDLEHHRAGSRSVPPAGRSETVFGPVPR